VRVSPAVGIWLARLGLGLALGLALAGGLLLAVRLARPSGLEVLLPTPTPVPQAVTVHITGAVAQPGVYTLPAGARLADAVRSAGGFAPGADPQGVNLALPLEDGTRYHIPSREESDRRVNLNTATREELEALPGIGPALAQAILDRRREKGPFRRLEDLLEVRGIGPATLERLRPLVRVD